MTRLRIGVIYGGRSGEHEVSLMSADSIARTLEQAGYEVVLIGIDKEGHWHLSADRTTMREGLRVGNTDRVALLAEPRRCSDVGQPVATAMGVRCLDGIDVFFPALHGTYGEDGSIQGLLEMADVPYVGAGVLASSVGMDKDVHKRLFREAGIPVLDFVTLSRNKFESDPKNAVKTVEAGIGYPCFVKPCNLGSSVGVSKAENRTALLRALEEAALYDRRIIVEKDAGDCHEIECSVLGNDDPIASAPGEIITAREFYDYKAKYIDVRSRTEIPANLPASVSERVRRLAIDCFNAIDCAGMARVDFFVLKKDFSIYVNEINTLPGFTPISMYPKMWEKSGISYVDLLSKLVDLAIERHKEKNRRRTDYPLPGEGLH